MSHYLEGKKDLYIDIMRGVSKNNGLSKKCGISPQNAARFSKVLLNAGLIKVVMESSSRRGAMYSFEPLLELIRV
ncbi:hypothetical protein [Abyssogena phaseoliformis symbiont]|uniref:hypothetical protein n=1 Tax=Abyssogena phaseoliformis symbiont TaxID=596095 RepID=UPI00315AB9CA